MQLRLLAACLLAAPLLACGGDGDPAPNDVVVDVSEVVRDPGGNPVLLLSERDGDRTLPIWVGLSEARSIAAKLKDVEPPRPNTHDLTKRLLDRLGARVERVIVTELRDRTYYGVIVMRGPTGTIEVDSRPSDAIALALRQGAPIFVREALFEEAASEPDEESEPPGQEVRAHRRRPSPPERSAPAGVSFRSGRPPPANERQLLPWTRVGERVNGTEPASSSRPERAFAAARAPRRGTKLV